MSVSFLTPLGALAALAVALPVLGTLVAERRGARIRSVLGLPAPRGRRRAWGLAAAGVFLLLGLAAVQPVLAIESSASARADAEAYVVIDTSRSMLAARGADRPTRFARAAELALRLRAEVPAVRVGVASLTDRTLPHLFPSADRRAFALVLERAVGIERPPPLAQAFTATDVAARGRLADHNFFSPSAVHRLAVVLTDGESRPFDAAALTRALERAGVELLVVSLWSPQERIYGQGPEDALRYRPDRRARRPLAALAEAGGATTFDEGELPAIVAAARAGLGHGPLVDVGRSPRLTPLAPYLVLASSLPLALLLAGRGGPVRLRAETQWE
jgi:hypothetical protein